MLTRLAMIMAGGEGLRMIRSGAWAPKALMPVAGVPMLERALWQLARHGFDDVVIATPASVPAVGEFARDHLIPQAAAHGCMVKVRDEQVPLGNIGAIQWLRDCGSPALIVYADNLTSLNLEDIYQAHVSSNAAMTIATHRQPFVMPFGEVHLDGDVVTSYREKPETMFNVCSAISVVGPDAVAAVKPFERLGLSNLVTRLIDLGLFVRAYPHEAAWIDVNDLPQVAQAEILISAHQREFACPPEWRESRQPIAPERTA